MYIRSSPRGPNRDPNWMLSNELLYIKEVFIKYRVLNKIILNKDVRFIAAF